MCGPGRRYARILSLSPHGGSVTVLVKPLLISWTICGAAWLTEYSWTSDGHKAYLEAVEGAFGGDVDYAQLVKLYGEPAGQKGQERK